MARNLSMPVSVYALGGLCEVGKNCYCIENEETLVMIDCGVLFPGDEFPGVDYLVPDFTHLKNNRNKIKALVITHGHEDHIGGIPFLIQNVNIPVIYAPKLAAALIINKLEDFRLKDRVKIVIYDENSEFHIDNFDISFFRVTHSIPDSFGIVVKTPEGTIATTGDFKIDLTPIGPDFELNKLARLGDEGIDLLLADSTNAENEGFTPSEKNVFDSINEVFNKAPGRLIISTFSSNISRIEQICQSALAHNRKIAIIGRSMENAVYISRAYGYIKIPDESLIDVSEVKNYKNSEILILCTGSQGEPMAALSRIANGDHKDIQIFPGDTVVFSSSAIPGNGIAISHVVNSLTRCGAEVITNSILSDIHSSGHPAKQELKLLLKIVKPRYFMPAHGEYHMLKMHSDVAQEVGIRKENIFILENGETITLNKQKCTLGYKVPAGVTYIDGAGIAGLENEVISDRERLSDDGTVIVIISINKKGDKLLLEPRIETCGFIYKKHMHVIRNTKTALNNELNALLAKNPTYAEIKIVAKKVTARLLLKSTKRRPMIIPMIIREQ